MIQEQRHVYFDYDLNVEAYNLYGIVQKFPNHFHEHYVIGFVEGGNRHLWCKGEEYDLAEGDLFLLNPRDNHFCAPLNGETLDYRALNIKQDIMCKAVKEITGKEYIPLFTQNVVHKCDLVQSIGDLYNAIINPSPRLEKEETLFFLLEQLLHEYAAPFEESAISEPIKQIKQLCSYMDLHYADNISLDDLLSMTNYSKSYLLRSFTKEIGISPYRYLQTIRLSRSKLFLEQGIAPIDAAAMTGFSDQSHFTNFFKEFIGLTPKQYQRIFIDASVTPEKENVDCEK